MMAKKSEFAQKLLDDLRMRKQKIAACAGQTYCQSYSSMIAQDAHGQSIKGQGSRRVAVASETGTYKTNGMHRRSSSCSGTSSVLESEHSSKQLVPFSQWNSAMGSGDVSAAIDFVFQNGHKLMMDSSVSIPMISFLKHITHGSVMDFQNSERKGRVNISNFHVNEISKGALKAELFQSSKEDLVESLRMLVVLQEAANNMTTQQKSRVSLLEGNEEDQATLEKQKPRFSFDKLSHLSTKREGSTSFRQRSVAVAYLTNDEASQRRSYSHSEEYSCKTSASEKRKDTSFNLNKSKPEKKGLPNIVAKLMGLEEASHHSETENEMRKEWLAKLTPNMADSRKTNKGAESSQTQAEKKRLLQADMENAEEGSLRLSEGGSMLTMQEKKCSRVTQRQMIQKESKERRNDRKAINDAQRVPRSHIKNSVVLPRKETKTKTEIRDLSRRLLSKRKLSGQPEITDQRRKVDRTEHKSRINGLHNRHQTEHHNRQSVETCCVCTSNQAIDKEYEHNLKSKDQRVGAVSSKTLPLKEDNYIQVKTSMNKVPKSKMHKSNSLKIVDQVKMKNPNNPQRLNNKSAEHQNASLKEIDFEHGDRRRSKLLAHDRSRGGSQPLQNTINPPLNEVENPSALQTHYLTDTLNEEETQLKCTLVLSLKFRNTVKALYKLNIPFNIISQTDSQEREGMEQKYTVEAAYEIMERKARRQELKVNPFTKSNCLSLREVQSLNELVKQLHKDIETLKCYGGVIWGDDTGACLLKMVERDMHCTEPDINCMWDYGWSDSCFALAAKYETIEELEKCIVDDLLDDILLHLYIKKSPVA